MLARSRDQARAAAWPGVITYIIITNKPRPDPPHCLSNSLDHITWPDYCGLAQFNAGHFATKCGCLNCAQSTQAAHHLTCHRIREAAEMSNAGLILQSVQ